ncbi:hypothetical protein ACSTLG_00530, partial [Vibrio parahaemolyticus]
KDRQNLMLLSHHLSKAAEVAELGIWSWHLDEADGDMEWNDRMYEIYGIAPDMRGMYMPVSIWSTTIHPDDIELVHAKIAEVARGEYS